jgi:hypothetical protein
MMGWKRRVGVAVTGILLTLVGGCGGPHVYQEETFALESPHRKMFPVSADTACDHARLALLSQGYVMQQIDRPDLLKGKKEFQPSEKSNVIIEFSVTCKNYGTGSIVFASAIQSTYELKKTKQSLSLGVPSASISLPWGETTEAQIKVGSETIDDADFYQRFFSLIDAYMKKGGEEKPKTP